MQTMKEIRAKAYRIPEAKGMTEEKAARIESALKYIEHLGVVTKTDVSQWPVLEIFQGPKGGLIADRSAINRKFFEWKERVGDGPKTPVQVMSDGLALTIEKKLRAFTGLSREKMEQELNRAMNNVRTYAREVYRFQDLASKLTLQLNENPDQLLGPKLAESIDRLVQEGKFIVPEDQPKNGSLILITTPIIKTFFNKKQATNLTVPMGQFKVIYNGTDDYKRLTVNGFKDNVLAEGRIHPHVHGDELCMGAMLIEFTKASAAFDFYKMFDVIYDCLANFEERDGYTPLHVFEAAYRKKMGIKEEPAPMPKIKAEQVNPDDEPEDPADREIWDNDDIDDEEEDPEDF